MAAGTLINAPNHRIYVLTADHCFIDKTQINNFRYWRAHPLFTSYALTCSAAAVNCFHMAPCPACSFCKLQQLAQGCLRNFGSDDCVDAHRLLIFNYDAPCGATESPPITEVIQARADPIP